MYLKAVMASDQNDKGMQYIKRNMVSMLYLQKHCMYQTVIIVRIRRLFLWEFLEFRRIPEVIDFPEKL